ncbi:hypothetical protein TSHO111613_17425 [Tsukamurella hominis]
MDMSRFGAYIKAHRVERDIKQAALIGSDGPGQTTIIEMESGRAWPSWQSIRKLQIAYDRLGHPDAGRRIAAVFRLIAPDAQFDAGISGRPEREADAPLYSTVGGLTLFAAATDRGPAAVEQGFSITRIALDTSSPTALSRSAWNEHAWVRFVDKAMDNAAFTFMANTKTLLQIFGPESLSHAYLQVVPRGASSANYRTVAIDPTWDLVSSEAARTALESLLRPRGEVVDTWAPLMLTTAARIARSRAKASAELAKAGGLPVPDPPSPLTYLFSGDEVAHELITTLERVRLFASAPQPAQLDKAAQQVLAAYDDIIGAIVGGITLSMISGPEFSSTAIRRFEDLKGHVWTRPESLVAARTIASAAHGHPSAGSRKGLTISDDTVTVGLWELSPSYSEPALEDVRAVIPFDDVFIGTYRRNVVAFRL